MSEKMDIKPDVNTEAAELKLLKKREQLAAAREKAKSSKVEREQKLRKKRSTNTRLKPELKPRLKPRLKTDLKTLLITNMTSVMKT